MVRIDELDERFKYDEGQDEYYFGWGDNGLDREKIQYIEDVLSEEYTYAVAGDYSAGAVLRVEKKD